MQIELLSYDQSTKDQTVTSSASRSTSQYRSTSDGFFIISNYENDPKVKELTNFLAQVAKTNMDQFRLVGVEFQ